jgi:hypothetical protein
MYKKFLFLAIMGISTQAHAYETRMSLICPLDTCREIMKTLQGQDNGLDIGFDAVNSRVTLTGDQKPVEKAGRFVTEAIIKASKVYQVTISGIPDMASFTLVVKNNIKMTYRATNDQDIYDFSLIPIMGDDRKGVIKLTLRINQDGNERNIAVNQSVIIGEEIVFTTLDGKKFRILVENI